MGADEGHAARRLVSQRSVTSLSPVRKWLWEMLWVELKYAAGFAEHRCQKEKRKRQDPSVAGKRGVEGRGKSVLVGLASPGLHLSTAFRALYTLTRVPVWMMNYRVPLGLKIHHAVWLEK